MVLLLLLLGASAGCSGEDTPGLDDDLDPAVSAQAAPDSYGTLAADLASAVADAVGTTESVDFPAGYTVEDDVCVYWSASHELPVWFGRDVSWDDVRAAVEDAVPDGWTLGDDLDIPGGYGGFDVTEDDTGAVVTVRAKGTSTLRVVAPVEGDCPDDDAG
ncbi:MULTISPECIES: hypothetical protein [unclassified Nocardioides]|uniref:hypothetical protein n=1 Tax=unclassified Nocardioides TaxID=2615069 RepID=UPI000B7AF364|nr:MULTISPECIES: hypothetical protein [unclassified Nocardioides]